MSSKRKAHGKLAEQISNKKKRIKWCNYVWFVTISYWGYPKQCEPFGLVSRVSDVQYLVF